MPSWSGIVCGVESCCPMLGKSVLISEPSGLPLLALFWSHCISLFATGCYWCIEELHCTWQCSSTDCSWLLELVVLPWLSLPWALLLCPSSLYFTHSCTCSSWRELGLPVDDCLLHQARCYLADRMLLMAHRVAQETALLNGHSVVQSHRQAKQVSFAF